jgi:hypothetical protein
VLTCDDAGGLNRRRLGRGGGWLISSLVTWRRSDAPTDLRAIFLFDRLSDEQLLDTIARTAIIS